MILRNRLCLLSVLLASCFVLSFQTARDSISGRLREIKVLEKNGEYSEALQKYKALFEQYPKNGRVFTLYKNLCLKTGKYNRAEEIIRKRLMLFPDDASLKASLASTLYKKGEHEKAFDMWDKILDEGSGVYVFQIVASSMIQERLLDRAIEVYEKGKRNTGRPEVFYLSIADLYISQLSFSKAGKELSNLLVSYPDFLPFVQSRIDRIPSAASAVNPLIKQGEKAAEKHQKNTALKKYLISLYIKAGLFDKAVKTEWTIVEVEKKNRENRLYSLAQKLFSKEEYKRVISLIHDIEKKFPDSPYMIKLLFLEAKSLEAYKDYNNASLKYRSIAEMFPKSIYASVSLLREGRILMEKLNNPAKAKEVFNKIVNSYPSSNEAPEARFYLGECELSLGNFKKAEDVFEKLRKKNLNYDKLWVKCTSLLGRSLFFNGETERSLKVLKELTVKEISPDGLQDPELNDGLDLYIFLSENNKKNPEQTALLGHAKFFNFTGQYEKALSSLDSLISLWPENSVTGYGMLLKSKILFNRGKVKSAVKTLSLLRERFSGSRFDEKAAERIGFFYEKSGKIDAAVKQYENFLETFPSSLLAGEVRERLRELKESSG